MKLAKPLFLGARALIAALSWLRISEDGQAPTASRDAAAIERSEIEGGGLSGPLAAEPLGLADAGRDGGSRAAPDPVSELVAQAAAYAEGDWPDAMHRRIAALRPDALLQFLLHPSIIDRRDSLPWRGALISACTLSMLAAKPFQSMPAISEFEQHWCRDLDRAGVDPYQAFRTLVASTERTLKQLHAGTPEDEELPAPQAFFRTASLTELGESADHAIFAALEEWSRNPEHPLRVLAQQSLTKDRAIQSQLFVSVQAILLCRILENCGPGSVQLAAWCDFNRSGLGPHAFRCMPGASLQQQIELNFGTLQWQYYAQIADHLYRLRYAN